MTLKPPTRTFPKLVMKEWVESTPERLRSYAEKWLSEPEVLAAIKRKPGPPPHLDPKALSDFTRVLEGVEGQKEAPLRKGDHE